MGWLLGPFIASIVSAFVVVRIFEFIFGGLTGSLVTVLRPILFVGTTATVTTTSGMSRFTSRVRKLQRGTKAVGDRLDSLTESDHKSRR